MRTQTGSNAGVSYCRLWLDDSNSMGKTLKMEGIILALLMNRQLLELDIKGRESCTELACLELEVGSLSYIW